MASMNNSKELTVGRLKRFLNSMDDRDIVTINVLDERTGENSMIHNPKLSSCLGVSLDGSWSRNLLIRVYLDEEKEKL